MTSRPVSLAGISLPLDPALRDGAGRRSADFAAWLVRAVPAGSPTEACVLPSQGVPVSTPKSETVADLSPAVPSIYRPEGDCPEVVAPGHAPREQPLAAGEVLRAIGELLEGHDIKAPSSGLPPIAVGDVHELPLDPNTMLPLGSPERAGELSKLRLAGTEDEPPAIEVPLTEGSVGHSQVIYVNRPWHLAANAGLSYRSSATVPGIRATDEVLVPAAPSALASIGETFAIPASRLKAVSQALGELPADGVEHAPSPTASDVARRSPAPTTVASPDWLPIPTWPQRLLRWTEDGDGSTAWIRDFSLPAAEQAPLVALLRGMADAQGVCLRRIMLNGHLLWRSSTR